MREQGQVTGFENGMAVIALSAQGGCASCGLNHCCQPTGGAHRVLRIDRGDWALSEGDRVEIETRPQSLLLAAFLIFIFPLVLSIGGYFIIQARTGSSGWALFGFFAVFALAELLLVGIDRTFGRRSRFTPRIVGKLPPEERKAQ